MVGTFFNEQALRRLKDGRSLSILYIAGLVQSRQGIQALLGRIENNIGARKEQYRFT